MDLTHGSLFSGIEGFGLAAHWAGIPTIWQVENNKFCQKILRKHFPNATIYNDIKELNYDELEPVDIISGGFPCQPFSQAGKRGGTKDDRYLWPEMLEVIKGVKPRWVIAENVPGIIGMELKDIKSDLEGIGYKTECFDIPACGIGLQTMERHIWIIATSISFGQQRCKEIENLQQRVEGEFPRDDSRFRNRWDISRTKFCRVDKRVSRKLDRNQRDRLKALGNAIVPQIAYLFFQAIKEVENG